MGFFNRILIIPAMFFLMCQILTVHGQINPNKPDRSENPVAASREQMKWFTDARYGMFIHWSPGCLSGKELSWSRRGPRPYDFNGHAEEEKTVPAEVYDNYYKIFNPTEFNAREWVKIAKDAGMKYIVFTSKHHDGFSNFFTGYSTYSIEYTSFKRDIVKELADACHEAGMKFGIYYSVRDWYHPYYLKGDNSRYREFYTGQLRELLTRYGKIDILWFDSTFGPKENWNFLGVLKMIYKLQPDILINDRYGNDWKGDFYTPEQRLGDFDREKAWEACACLVDGQWSYRPNGVLLTQREVLGMLLGSAGGDGNLLLDIGPQPNGMIEERQADRLRETGDWIRKYSAGIYGTRGGPFKSGYWGYSTLKVNLIYLFLNPWDTQELTLPDPGAKVISAKLLNGGDVKTSSKNGRLILDIPVKYRSNLFTVVELKLSKNAMEIGPVTVPSSGSLTAGKTVSAGSNGMPRLWWHNPCAPALAVDDNINTRWRAEEGTSSAWLETDLGASLPFDNAMIEDDGTVEKFEIQIKEADSWHTIYQGETIGRRHHISFDKVHAQYVRFNILSAKDTPSIWEFQLFDSDM